MNNRTLKHHSAESMSVQRLADLEKLNQRFEKLDLGLAELEAKIESNLPGLGIEVSPMGNKRKGIPVALDSKQVDLIDATNDTTDEEYLGIGELEAGELEAGELEATRLTRPSVNRKPVSRRRKPKPR